ncbi:PREDICTED: ER membrane protein complex subunit 8/9 homolog [Dufourea novaeangliae]|uniref:ER membrane protein complex subunit 8/9 like protein n=1 Tax=Dufourea novaeangliae TaxID=178035 RepID=A0A154NX02_DUFNO|nr:PREDICTED: ER membrane protein complex subunit 8/9 homolog [Dufourea novaeangliae]KZC04215.1 ER membrane protein complex subunit 8/9 like protein [Dufourea novaeangliae]
MADISFSSRAYSKIILHATKYPHCALNGLLLAKQKNKSDSKSVELRIEDAIPLFHICLHVSPMAEIALTMVDQLATSKGLIIAGYYLANENLSDLSTDKPAHRIADKIAENYGNGLLVVIDNREITFGMNSSPLRVSQFMDGKWKLKDVTDITYDKGIIHTNALYNLFKAKQYRNLIDFDNHLDNISLDWQNRKLNKIIDEAVEKYK